MNSPPIVIGGRSSRAILRRQLAKQWPNALEQAPGKIQRAEAVRRQLRRTQFKPYFDIKRPTKATGESREPLVLHHPPYLGRGRLRAPPSIRLILHLRLSATEPRTMRESAWTSVTHGQTLQEILEICFTKTRQASTCSESAFVLPRAECFPPEPLRP